jgi:hypothetical protein
MSPPPPASDKGPDVSRQGPEISAAQVAGSALAAVSAAVIASFLGVGGTIIGAALGSIVASVGGAVYSHSFKRAGDRLGETRVLTVVTRPHHARALPGPGDVPVIEEPGSDPGEPAYAASGADPTAQLELGEVAVGEGAHGAGALSEGALSEGAEGGGASGAAEPERTGLFPPPGGQVPRRLSWKGAVALTVVAFVLAIAAIEVVELVIGRPISGGSGGTTITKLVKPSTSKPKVRKPTPSPSSTTPVSTPSTTSTTTPTSTPTPTPSDTTTTGSPSSTGPIGPTGTPTG